MCYSAAPSTTNQNATQRIHKGYKVARKFLQAYIIKIQYEIVIKGDRCCSCYTYLPRTAPAAAQTSRKMAAPSIGTGSPQIDQHLLTDTWPKTVHNINIHATIA